MKSRLPSLLFPVLLSLVASMLLAAACGSSEPDHRNIPVKLEGGKLRPDTIRVGQGDTVTLQIEAEEPGEIHLHGYDIEAEVSDDSITDLAFVANDTGRFRITFHAAGIEGADHGSHEGETHDDSENEEVDVGFLEVRPR